MSNNFYTPDWKACQEADDPCDDFVCTAIKVQGPAIAYSVNLQHEAKVYLVVADKKHEVASLIPNSKGYAEVDLNLCGTYLVEVCHCKGQEKPVVNTSAFNPSTTCDNVVVPKGALAATTLDTDCFETNKGLISLTPVLLVTEFTREIIYYRGATPFTGKVGKVCAPLDCEKCCKQLNETKKI